MTPAEQQREVRRALAFADGETAVLVPGGVLVLRDDAKVLVKRGRGGELVAEALGASGDGGD